MLSRTVRASRPILARLGQPATVRRTLFTPSAIRSADMVQDMYLRELKNYKAPQLKASDAEGQVQKFKMPAAPASPEEGDLAKDLNAYETQAVEVEGQAAAGEAQAVEEDWFEEDEDFKSPLKGDEAQAH